MMCGKTVLAVTLIFIAMTIVDLSQFGNGICELPITKNRIEKLLLVPILLPLLFRQMVEQLLFFGHIAYTQDYELKFSIQTKFYTLISNLNLHVQYKIQYKILMT